MTIPAASPPATGVKSPTRMREATPLSNGDLPNQSDEEGSDPLLVPSPSNDSKDGDDEEEDMHSAIEVLVRFEDDGAPKTNGCSRQGYSQHGRKSLSRSALIQKLRHWFAFYIKYLQSSPFHQDRLLKALQWTSWLASCVLVKNKKLLEKLSLDLSMARYATRLLELPTALQATWTGEWTAQSIKNQTVFNWLGRTLSWSMVGYYPTEYLAYIMWKSECKETQRRANEWSAWSCRFWFLYLVADLVQSSLQYKELQELPEKQVSTKALTKTRLQVVRNALFILPCIHWALPNWDTKPWLSTNVVNGLMWLEAMVSLYQTGLTVTVCDENDDEGEDKIKTE